MKWSVITWKYYLKKLNNMKVRKNIETSVKNSKCWSLSDQNIYTEKILKQKNKKYNKTMSIIFLEKDTICLCKLLMKESS